MFGERDADGGVNIRRRMLQPFDRTEDGKLSGRIEGQRMMNVGRAMMPESRVPGADGTPMVGDYTGRTMDQATGLTRRMMDVPYGLAGDGGGAGGMDMADRNGNGIPDGAEVTRTITMQGPNGETDKTVFKYGGSGMAGARKMMQPSLSGQDRLALSRGESMLNRDTGVGRAGTEIRRRMMGDVSGFNEALDRDAQRDTAMGVEGIKAGGVVGRANATGRWGNEQAATTGRFGVQQAEAGRQRYTGLGGGGYIDQDTGASGYVGPSAGQDEAGLKPGQRVKLDSGQDTFWNGSAFLDAKTGAPVFEKPAGMSDYAWLGLSNDQKLEAMRIMHSNRQGGQGPAAGAGAAGGPREGQTATNPQTGTKMVYRNGTWVGM